MCIRSALCWSGCRCIWSMIPASPRPYSIKPEMTGPHRTYQRVQSAILSAEISAQERLAIVLARLQRSDRRSERRSTGRPEREFWR